MKAVPTIAQDLVMRNAASVQLTPATAGNLASVLMAIGRDPAGFVLEGATSAETIAVTAALESGLDEVALDDDAAYDAARHLLVEAGNIIACSEIEGSAVRLVSTTLALAA